LRRHARGTVYLLFLVSGVSGLVYEVVWTRMLTVVFGNTVFAVSTVLAAFMTGLALGSFLFGRAVDRRGNPLRVYALLEMGIALSAVLLTALLWHINPATVWVQRALSDNALLLILARYLVSFSLLIVPSTLMGGTLPVLSKFVVEHESSLGRHVGGLYALNTLGAAAGCYAAGFLFIGRIGLNRTVAIAVFLNLCVGVLAWWLGARAVMTEKPKRVSPAEARVGSEAEGGRAARSLRRLVLCAMALSGFAALGYEVVWTKGLTFALGNSVYAFASMLTTFLIGLAVGSILCSWLVDRAKRLVAVLGGVEAGIGVYGIVCVHLFAYMLKSDVSTPAGWAMPAGTGFLRAFLIMLFPTLLMGATFPLAARIYTADVRQVGRGVGNVYSFNTVGALLGSVATGFVLVPLLGLQDSMAVLGLINIVLGLTLCAAEPRMRRRAKTICLAAILGASVLVLWATPDDMFRRVFEKGKRFIYYKEEVSGTVWVKEVGPYLRLLVDRRDVAGTNLRTFDSQKILGHLPMLLHPNPKRVFVLGFGAGGTCYSMSTHPEVERIDSAEFCPAVVEAAELLPEINHGILQHPKLHLVINDGRNFLLTSDATYDVISVDLLYPDTAGTGSLYTKEFYEICRRSLKGDGIMAEWLPPHLLSMRDMKIILKTCQSVFAHTAVWWSPYYNCLMLIASPKALELDFLRVAERMDYPTVRRDLGEIHITNPYALAGYFVASDEALAAYAGDVDILNTDDLPVIEYSAPRARNDEMEIRRTLLYMQQPIVPFLTNLGKTREESDRARARLRAAVESMQYVQRAILAGGEDSMRYYARALELDSTNAVARQAMARAHVFLAMSLAQQGRGDEAVAHMSVGLQADRHLAKETIFRFERRVASNPDHPGAHLGLSIALASVGKTEDAIAHVRTALRLQPNFPGAASFLKELEARLETVTEDR